jgi:hypothetical protein
MAVDVNARIQKFIASNGVSQKEIRQLRNELTWDQEGVTRSELNALRSAYRANKDNFTATGALETERVLGLGIKKGANGKGEYVYAPFSGIDAVAKFWATRWGVKDQFDPKFPTYQKELDNTKLPSKIQSASKRIVFKQIQQWAKEYADDGKANWSELKPAWASTIYDRNRKLIGYNVGYSYSDQVSGECFLKLDKSSKDGFKVVGARYIQSYD